MNPSPSHHSLIELMTVLPTEDPATFTGITESYGMLGIYGGHFLGQSLSAGFATVEEPKLAQSLHGYFLRKGDPDAPLHYRVSTLRESRGSSVRAIAAIQHEAEVFHMIAAFKLPESGEEHQKQAPSVASPQDCRAAREARGGPPSGGPTSLGGRVEVEMVTPAPMEFVAGRTPELQTWSRVPDGGRLDDRQRQVVTAFLADGTLMFNSVLPYGRPFDDYRLTSLDQSVWFHRLPDPGDWMLFDQRSTAAADGRGLNEGEIYGADGRLFASCAQESMLRSNR